MDTYSDLLFAIAGGEAEFSMSYPLDAAPRNDTMPNWLFQEVAQGGAHGQGSSYAAPKGIFEAINKQQQQGVLEIAKL